MPLPSADLVLDLAVLVTFACWVYIVRQARRLRRTVPGLAYVEPVPPADGWPLVSVLVPARNEAAQIRACITSLLAQSYPQLEVLAIDDRSTDGTGEILDDLARRDDRLRVRHLTGVPDGWMGKNHANHAGAGDARGRWLLFTDADVHFAPHALRRAIALAEACDLDHLVVTPTLLTRGLAERAFVGVFALAMQLYCRIWELERPRTSGYIGVGQFNLIRRDAYRRIGGHTTVAMETLDDVRIGLVLRRSGFRQGCAVARWRTARSRSAGSRVSSPRWADC
jgi:glycosyltransferase involved in cell wall biosynthesis